MHAFLREHYEIISEVLDRRTPKWRACAQWLASQKVVGARGQAPSAESLRQMWPAVKREVAVAREMERRREEERVRTRPNRSPPKAGPPPVAAMPMARVAPGPQGQGPPRQTAADGVPPGQPASSVGRPSQAGSGTKRDRSHLSPDVQAKLARFDDKAREFDRYLPLPPLTKSP